MLVWSNFHKSAVMRRSLVSQRDCGRIVEKFCRDWGNERVYGTLSYQLGKRTLPYRKHMSIMPKVCLNTKRGEEPAPQE